MSQGLESLSNVKNPTLVVNVVSVQRLFRTNLNQERFDHYVQTSGADYVLKVQESSRAREITQLLCALDLAEMDSADHADLRYQIDVADGGVHLATLYADASGDIVSDGKRWRTRSKDNWLRRIWKILEAGVVK